MSNPTTNFIVGGIDLSTLFLPIDLGVPYPNKTGYKISDGRDLNEVFASYISGPYVSPTGIKISTGEDLSDIFADINTGPIGPSQWTKQLKSPNIPNNPFAGLTCSNDGYKISGFIGNGYIYTSTNAGVTWTTQYQPNYGYWASIACSSDGSKIVTCRFNPQGLPWGNIFRSIDSGYNWTIPTDLASNWGGIASSSDGVKLAAIGSGYLYTSSDSGTTWVNTNYNAGFRAVRSSSDGTRLVLCTGGNSGSIYISTNSGVTLTKSTSAGSRYWDNVACSADGMKIAATVQTGYIWTSTDGGNTWLQRTSGPYYNWYGGVAWSGDGSKLIVGGYPGYIWISTDDGANWEQQTDPGSRPWGCIACSYNGGKIIAAPQGYSSDLYLWTY